MKEGLLLLCWILRWSLGQGYNFSSPIDNLLYLSNTSTLFAISSSHLHQLHWSSTNQTLLLLHRRVQLHESLDQTDQGVSVFIYHPSGHVLLVCARSTRGRCVLYDANDISRVYELDSSVPTNDLGCLSGCYTYLSSNVIRSAFADDRLDRNGNIVNSQIVLSKDLHHFDIQYQSQSSEKSLSSALTFLSDRKPTPEYLYGFDDELHVYFVIKSSRLARLCQASVAMSMTYEEIPLLPCQTTTKRSIITGAFYSSKQLYVIYDDRLCLYTIDEIHQAFQSSRHQCENGFGHRLAYLVTSDHGRPKCQKTAEQTTTPTKECTWNPYRTNTYMDGSVGAQGIELYRSTADDGKILFVFAHTNRVILGTSEGHVLKLIQHDQASLLFLHRTIFNGTPLNSKYVLDDQHQSLILAVSAELHHYAYNSCSLYDTCQSCVVGRRYEHLACQWRDGTCSWTSAMPGHNDRCPPSIDQIQPMNASVNTERVLLHITGSFHDVSSDTVQVTVTFPLPNQNPYFCTIKSLQQDRLTCSLLIPKQPTNGTISIDIQPTEDATSDISGSVDYHEKFHVYVPSPTLVPSYGPAAGGTRIQIKNLALLDDSVDVFSTMKIFLGQNNCPIIRYDPVLRSVECLNPACSSDLPQLPLSIVVNGRPWQLQETFFQCRTDPIVFDWYPNTTTVSGGHQVMVSGQNLDAVQSPRMKLVSESLNLEWISLCTPLSTTEMNCSTPKIDEEQTMDLPLDLTVSFIMDNLSIAPHDDILVVVADPIYYPFENFTQQINASGLLHIQGSNLATSHSIEQIDVHIDHVPNACLPVNLTKTDLLCSLSKSAAKQFKNVEPIVEVHVGSNLHFSIGRIALQDRSELSSLQGQDTSKGFSTSTIAILLTLASLSVFALLLTLVMVTRRRLYRSFHEFRHNDQPPGHMQPIWSELGKQWHIDRKDLIIGEKIGQACFSDIFKGHWKQKQKKSTEVFLKILRDRSVSSMHDFLSEVNRMKDLSHPHLLSLIGVSWDSTRQAMVLLPYMKKGDLRSYISDECNRPTMRQLMTWAVQVADGMRYLASLRCVHRDLAARNCMLDETLQCRIADFSLGQDVDDRDYYLVPTATRDEDGNPIQSKPRRIPIRWLSPEAIESSKYTIQSDVWAFGVLLWELLTRGKTPYCTVDHVDIYKHVKEGHRLPFPLYCPALLYRSVMSMCWHADPSQRPSFAQLAHTIRHILRQLGMDQQRLQSSSPEDDDTTIVQHYPMKDESEQSSATSLSSTTTSSNNEQCVATPRPPSGRTQLQIDRTAKNKDGTRSVPIHSRADIFTSIRLLNLPDCSETSIARRSE